MMGLGGNARRGVLFTAGLGLAVLPAHALAPAALSDLAALKKLERGRWEIVDLDRGRHHHNVCLGDPLQLVQVEHRGPACTRETVKADAGSVTVQYSCAGHGFGHTRVRVETPRLARINTQGLIDGRPFSWRGEARRTGAC
jgi:hypothetical protein